LHSRTLRNAAGPINSRDRRAPALARKHCRREVVSRRAKAKRFPTPREAEPFVDGYGAGIFARNVEHCRAIGAQIRLAQSPRGKSGSQPAAVTIRVDRIGDQALKCQVALGLIDPQQIAQQRRGKASAAIGRIDHKFAKPRDTLALNLERRLGESNDPLVYESGWR
jgi:hypothetical protein